MQPRRSRQEWRRIVESHRSSGLKAVDFARREGLNVNTFSWWRHELRQEARRDAKLTLVPVSMPSRRTPLLVRLPDGTEIEVPHGAEPVWVGRIATALR